MIFKFSSGKQRKEYLESQLHIIKNSSQNIIDNFEKGDIPSLFLVVLNNVKRHIKEHLGE